MTTAIQSILKEINHMNMGNPTYEITRRGRHPERCVTAQNRKAWKLGLS
jgi:hypothetical protein